MIEHKLVLMDDYRAKKLSLSSNLHI